MALVASRSSSLRGSLLVLAALLDLGCALLGHLSGAVAWSAPRALRRASLPRSDSGAPRRPVPAAARTPRRRHRRDGGARRLRAQRTRGGRVDERGRSARFFRHFSDVHRHRDLPVPDGSRSRCARAARARRRAAASCSRRFPRPSRRRSCPDSGARACCAAPWRRLATRSTAAGTSSCSVRCRSRRSARPKR